MRKTRYYTVHFLFVLNIVLGSLDLLTCTYKISYKKTKFLDLKNI